MSDTLSGIFSDLFFLLNETSSYCEGFAGALVAVLVAVSVIWTTAIAWRKFKETTNKV